MFYLQMLSNVACNPGILYPEELYTLSSLGNLTRCSRTGYPPTIAVIRVHLSTFRNVLGITFLLNWMIYFYSVELTSYDTFHFPSLFTVAPLVTPHIRKLIQNTGWRSILVKKVWLNCDLILSPCDFLGLMGTHQMGSILSYKRLCLSVCVT